MKNVFSLIFAICGLALLCMASGCSLCCAPYDYCGPVYANGCCANLARQRCGTAFNQTQMPQQVTYDANGQPIPVQNQPTPAPQHIPGDTPASAMSAPSAMPQNQGMTASQFQAPYRQASANPTARPSAVSSAPAMSAMPSQQMAQAPQMAMLPAEPSNVSAPTPINGKIAVNADGFQKVAVYDENQQLLGYEIIDATGKSVQQLPAPESAR